MAYAYYTYQDLKTSPENIVATEQSGLVKLYFSLRRRAERCLDDAQLYWRTHHGPIIRRRRLAPGS